LKIRIFALAKELGLDSKVLIDLCNEAGLNIKASALASITPDEKDMVLQLLDGKGPAEKQEPAESEPAPLTRPVNTNKGRVRAMPLPGKGGATETAEPEVEPEEVAEPEPVEEEVVEAPAEEVVAAPAAEEPKEEEAPVPVAESDEAESDKSEPDDELGDAKEEESADAKPEEPEKPEEKAKAKPKPKSKPAPIVRVRPAPPRPMREMTPQGNLSHLSGKKAKPKPKAAALPNIAAVPTYQPPVPKADKKKTEEVVQKPDMPLNAEALKHGPLDIKEIQRGRGRGGGRRGKSGSLLEQLKKDRQAQREGRRPNRRRKGKRGPVVLKSSAQIDMPITVRSLSEAIGRPVKPIITYLMKQGKMAGINDSLTEDEAIEIAMDFEVELDVRRGRDMEQELLDQLDKADPDESLSSRPPIITILGHVDHGKTTLVDKLRGARVAAGEAGGITQHIASYQVEHNDQMLTFVDTPGHAAFSEMRARGAGVTDIIVLVVAADDGVMPQTVECIAHAKAAGVPIVVAMNKIDLPDVDEEKVLTGLAQHELLPVEWSGDIEVVRTSGETGQGLDELLETLLLTAELHEFKANAEREAVGVCLEGYRDQGLGVVAWFIVQKGTLRVGDTVLCGPSTGRIRAMYDDVGSPVMEAPPSMPVRITGLDIMPGAGDHFFVMKDIEEAREVAQQREQAGRAAHLAETSGKPRTITDIIEAAQGSGSVQELPLIIKTDMPGSLQALKGEIGSFEHDEVRVRIIHSGVGGVNESDVSLAAASGAVIIAFHVVAEEKARAAADEQGVEIKKYNIIYEITDHIRNALEGMLKPELQRVTTGRALVLQTFSISRYGVIAGCRILNGTIGRDNRIQVVRDQKILNEYKIASLKREKDDAKEVREGMECGIRLDGFNDIKEGDLFEAYRVDEIQRTLDD
jgi:translation initiation factor IF-2